MKILCSSDPPTAKKIKSVQKALHTYSKKKTDWDAQTAPQKSTKQPPKVMGPSNPNPNPNPNNEADADVLKPAAASTLNPDAGKTLVEGVARGELYTLTYQSNGSIGLGLDKVYACEEEIGGKVRPLLYLHSPH